MLTIRYPGYDVHKHFHRQFMDALDRLKTDFEHGDDVYEDVKELYRRLTRHHIADTDTAMFRYVREMFPPSPLAEKLAALEEQSKAQKYSR